MYLIFIRSYTFRETLSQFLQKDPYFYTFLYVPNKFLYVFPMIWKSVCKKEPYFYTFQYVPNKFLYVFPMICKKCCAVYFACYACAAHCSYIRTHPHTHSRACAHTCIPSMFFEDQMQAILQLLNIVRIYHLAYGMAGAGAGLLLFE